MARIKKGLTCAIITLLLWSQAPIAIKYLSVYFDVNTQNFFRYILAGLFLMVLYYRQIIHEIRKLSFISLIVPAILLFSYQTAFVNGIYLTTATIAALLLRLTVIFTSIFAYMFFKEERSIITSRSFIVGTALAMIGAMAIITTSGRASASSNVSVLGSVLIMLSDILWSLYLVSVKINLRNTNPQVLSSLLITIAGTFFLPISVIKKSIFAVLYAPSFANLLMIVSGVLFVGIGNLLNYLAINELGVAIPSALQLASPLLTAISSVIVFHEEMPLGKVISGVLIMSGCSLIIYSSYAEQNTIKQH
mgnify:CR=1 FL=1